MSKSQKRKQSASVTKTSRDPDPPPDKKKLYQAFKTNEQETLAKTGVILSSVYYLLDHKAIAYKLECDTDYLMTFLNKREDASKAESMQLLQKLCVNQDVQNLLLKEQNFSYIVDLCHNSPIEEIRSSCYKIFATLSQTNPSKQVVKQLFFKSKLILELMKALEMEQSEDVLCSIISFLMKLTSEEVYMELITQEIEIIQSVVNFMSYHKNKRLKRLAYAITANFLCEEELRRALMRLNKVDVIGKLVGVLNSFKVAETLPKNISKKSMKVNNKQSVEDVKSALKALSNALQDNLLLLNFLQQKGHIALNEVFESEELEVKELCLCLYVRLAQDKENNILIVLESDLIMDVLNLDCKDKLNFNAMRNMLILLNVMLATQNEKAIEQMKEFDILVLLLHIVSESEQLGYLAVCCIGLLAKINHFKLHLQDKNKDNSTLGVFIKAIQKTSRTSVEYKYLLRGIQVYLLAYDEIDGNHVEPDQVISLIQALNEFNEEIEDPTAQFYLILILKRLSEMKNRQIGDIVLSLEQYQQQLMDCPGIDSYQAFGFVNEILETEIIKNMVFYHKDEMALTGMSDQKILFYTDHSKALAKVQETYHIDQEISELKLMQKLSQAEGDRKRLQEEIKTIVGVNYDNLREKAVQTDFSLVSQQSPDEPEPQAIIKKQKEDLLHQARMMKEQRIKIEYLSERLVELEQDVQIRDKALSKLTQGTQMADVIGSVKNKIREDISHKFLNMKSHIEQLEKVIDTNTKLIKDLTESVQERNMENLSLKNEEKVKLGKIETLQTKCSTLEKQLQASQKKETQLLMEIERLTRMADPNFKELKIVLPQIQLSTEQVQISELQEQVIQLKVENLRLEEEKIKVENDLRRDDIRIKDFQNELDKYVSKHMIDDRQYVLKQIQANPNNLDYSIQKINEALQYIDKTITRHNFKEQLLTYYEQKLSRLYDKHEQLLIKYLQQQSHLQISQSQLAQLKLINPAFASGLTGLQVSNETLPRNDTSITDLLQQQWTQTEKLLKKAEQYAKEQFDENKRLRIRVQEQEETLAKYKKIVIFDHTQYERLFKLKNEIPLSQTEVGLISVFLNGQQVSEFQRLARILDVVIKSNIDLEYKVYENTSEKLRNEYHLIIEEREMQLRQRKTEEEETERTRRLEFMIEQIELDTQSLQVMNQPSNDSQVLLQESFRHLQLIQDLLSQSQQGSLTVVDQKKQATTQNDGGFQNKQDQKPQASKSQTALNRTADQIKAPSGQKKVQTTNLVQVEGRKPRLANDYNKQQKKQNLSIGRDFFDQMEQHCRELYIRLQQAEKHLIDEQKIRARQASDSLKEIQILKDTLSNRQQENLELAGDLKRILLTKNELTNQLMVRDFIIQNIGVSNGIVSNPLSMTSQSQKNSPKASKSVKSSNLPNQVQLQSNSKAISSQLEGLTRVNNFVRKKELEAREECDLIKHKIEKTDKERLALTLENRKLSEQIRYLQQLLKNQRDQFRRGLPSDAHFSSSKTNQTFITGVGVQPSEEEVPEDEIVKLLVQIDELNQRNSEMEYLLQTALQTNLEKEKLLRGTEDIILEINLKIENVVAAVQNMIPISKRSKDVVKELPKMPAYTGPETVYERLNALNIYAGIWEREVHLQINELQKQKDYLENLKPSNQTLTQAEHQAKLEKYLGIYSSRIQTLSSIIASYQRHFKSLEDQIRELQGMPNINAMNQLPTQKQIESARIESLKRMITLKDILIKHQQNDIELVKKSIIADKLNENCIYYVSPDEKQAILSMRQFDMQVKVIQDYERQMLMTRELDDGDQTKAKQRKQPNDEYVYIKQVNEKMQQDLLNVREVFKADWNENKVAVKLVNGQPVRATLNAQVNEAASQTPIESQLSDAILKQIALETEKKEYLQKWLAIVKDLIQSQFDQEKCKFYMQTLNQEVPLILSIMSRSSVSSLHQGITFKGDSHEQVSLEKEYLKQKVQELQERIDEIESKSEKTKTKFNYIRSKNLQLQEQNILLKKFLHSKKAMADDFKRFYKADLIQENEYLRSSILNMLPYNDKAALEIGVLKQQVKELNQKIIKQDERHITEQELFQHLEQALLDTQKKLIEKDSEVVRLIKAQKEAIFGGKTDQVLDLLINTADTLNLETVKLREQNWQLSQSLRQKRIQLELKTSKIKQSKNILKQFEDQIRELLIENEKLKVIKGASGSLGEVNEGLESLLQKKEPLNKDKLIYELGKEGAATVTKFLDEIAFFKSEISRLATEQQQLKVQNTTLSLLVQDKQAKLQEAETSEKLVRKENGKLSEKVEKLEFMYNKVNDDFIAQQQALEVYISLAGSAGLERNEMKSFSRCIDNAKVLAYMLQDIQKQRNQYYEQAIYYEREAHLTKEQLKVLQHEMDQLRHLYQTQETKQLYSEIQNKMIGGVMARYEKQLSHISQIVQESQTGIESLIYGNNPQAQQVADQQLSPTVTKMKHLSAIDSPQNNKKLKKQPEKLLKLSFTDRSSIHVLLNSHLEFNKIKAQTARYLSKIQSMQTKSIHQQVLIAYQTQMNSNILTRLNQELSLSLQLQYQTDNLKLQNIYLGRLCLYSHRVQSTAFNHNNMEGMEQIEQLMSQEIDKLKIENRLLQEKTEALEKKLNSLTQEQPVEARVEQTRYQMIEKELNLQIEWNNQLEKEILTKAAQIDALSKLHSDFSQHQAVGVGDKTISTQVAQLTLAAHTQADKKLITGAIQSDDAMISNLRSEYQKLEQKNSKLHERIYLIENKSNQKDQKLQLFQQRIRDLEKQLLQYNDTTQVSSVKDQNKGKTIKEASFVSGREIQLHQDIDEVWNKMRELNDLKNALYDRNDGLRIEIEAFKTHFSQYEAQEVKKRIQGQDSFQYHLYNELTLLREERDILIWQQNIQAARILEYQADIERIREQIPSMEKQILSFEQREETSLNEVQRLKEQMLQLTIAQNKGGIVQKDYDSIRTLLQLYEGGRLRRDKLHMVFENARLRRENDSLRKDIDSSNKLKQMVLDREYSLKKKIVDLKNELVRLRVTYDMGEYQTLVSNSPSKAHKQTESNDQRSKVQQYVESLTVLREGLLKIEFRNIELEELYAKKEHEVDDLKQNIKDLEKQIESNESKQDVVGDAEIDYHSQQVVDLQQRLMEEKWANKKLQTRTQELELQNKELLSTQDKHFEEIKEHHKMHTQISILETKIKDLQRPSQSMGIFQGDIIFYDTLKERFLNQLGMYIDDIRWRAKLYHQALERNRVLEDQLMRLTIQSEAFSQERDQYKLLVDKIMRMKVNEAESDFVSSSQHEVGATKLEVLIANQRKRIVSLKAQLEVTNNEKEIIDQNMKGLNEVIKNLEKHSMEYNSELTDAKDECIKLRGERERYEQRIGYMWERLDFQQRLHHKVVTNNPTLEQVITVYKEEIGKLKAFLHHHLGKSRLRGHKSIEQSSQQVDTTKSHVINLESEVSRLKVIQGKLEEQTRGLNFENDELRLYIRLVDMIRKTVGIQDQERDSLNAQLTKKRNKSKDLKMKYMKESLERDRLMQRVEFLERQIVELRQENPNQYGFVKATVQDQNEEQVVGRAPITNDIKTQMIKDLEGENQDLRQKLLDLQRAQQDSGMTGSKRQARAITPVRIRDMQIKTNTSSNLSQRLLSLKGGLSSQEPTDQFYYGQGVNLDPLQQLREDISEAIQVRQQQLTSKPHTKLPLIGNPYQSSQQDIQPSASGGQITHSNFGADRGNMTPIPNRMKMTSYSTLDPVDQQKPPKPVIDGKLRHSSVNRNQRQMGNVLNMSTLEANPNNLQAPLVSNAMNSSHSGIGPQLSHQGSFSSSKNLGYKNI